MRPGLGITLIIIALAVGVLVGYGVWGSNVSAITGLEAKVLQLMQENAYLKAQLPAEGVPTTQVAGTSPTAPLGSTTEKD